MADELLKKVRVTDDIILEVYKQGSKRKYSVITDSTTQIKSDKYDISQSDDSIINHTLEIFSIKQDRYDYKVIQDPYKDPYIKRTYGNGNKSPYYLNNGCAINIQWIGDMPNPEFNPGTYSNLYRAERAGEDIGKPRYLENVTITSTADDANNSDTLPKSSWSVSPPITDRLQPVEVSIDYRDKSTVQSKIVTVTLPKGSTENEGKDLVWTNKGLQYESKALPKGTKSQETILINGRAETAYTVGDIIQYYSASDKDSEIIDQVINYFKGDVSQLHGISMSDYDLKLCLTDTEPCSLIEYKSPLIPPNKTTNEAAVDDTPPVPTKTIVKLKFNIEGLPEVIEVKAKEDLPTFTVWAGSIPKPISEQIDDFEDSDLPDSEYIEGDFSGKEEGTMIFEAQEYPSEEIRKQTEQNAQKVNESDYTPGKHKLDMIPGIFKGNGGMEISCCQIHGKPVNIKIADSLLDLIEAAKNDGVTVRVASGFRPDFYPNINAKSESGVSVQAQSQEELYKQNCGNGKCDPDTAKPGKSKHGSGIAIDFNCGSKETVKFRPLNESVYTWMIKNSWKFGFVRTVSSEEWHFEYWPTESKSGPYAKVSKSNNQYWSYLGLNNLQAPNWS